MDACPNFILNNSLYIGKTNHYDKLYEGEHDAIISMDTWILVKELKKYNLVANTARKSKVYSTFKGLLRCGHCGGAMGITYTSKNSKRYYYYACRKHEKRAENECPLVRVPCGDVERIILNELGKLFKTPSFILKIIKTVNNIRPMEATQITDAFNTMDELWKELFPGEKARVAYLLVENIVVLRNKLRINLKKEGLESVLRELDGDNRINICHSSDDLVTVEAPIAIRYAQGRKIIISPELDGEDNDITPLARRLALGHKWNQMILSGEAASTKEIAERYDLQYSYVGHTLKMTTLAPDLQRAILNGENPMNLNTNSIKKALPESWQEQKSIFG